METKICSQCKQEKTLDKFRKKIKTKTDYRAECKACLRQRYIEYISKEKIFILHLYLGMCGKYRKTKLNPKSTEEKIERHKVQVTQEQFFELWEEHKKQYGLHCCISKVPFTFIRGRGRTTNHKDNNNVSVDRLDNNMGYTTKNIIFVTYAFNDRKNSVTILDCISILRMYKQRYPESNTCKLIELYESIGSLQTREKYKEEIKDFTKEKLS